MLVEIKKKYRTRSGKEVRIYFVHQSGPFPVHGAYRSTCGYWIVTGWTEDGRNRTDCENHVNDLVEVETDFDGNALTEALKTFNQQYDPQ